MPLLEYTGNAVISSLVSGISASATLMTLGSSQGWPTGLTAQWTATIDQGGQNEEKVLCSTRSGNVVTIVQRGYDGTAAKTHEPGESVKHTISAVAMSESSQHVNLTSRDDHTQYLNNLRHDDPLRHTIGSVIPAGIPGTIAPDDTAAGGSANSVARSDHRHAISAAVPVDVGTALAEGVAASFARSDHIHKLGTDTVTPGTIADLAIDSLALFISTIRPVFVDATAPASPQVGQLWLDTDITTLFLWSGTEWLIIYEPIQTYTPTWTAVTSNPSIGSGILEGHFQRSGKRCHFNIFLEFAGDTSGGAGDYTLGLPPGVVAAAAPNEQVVHAKCFTNGPFNFDGFAFIVAGGSICWPQFPVHALSSADNFARNADASAAAGTGVPQITGQYTWESGRNLVISGSYLFA